MKSFKYFFFLVLIIVIAFSIYVSVQPNSFQVSRSRMINAPVSLVYNHVIDFKTWESWSSWVEKDADLKITLPEQTKGVGGSYSWEDHNGMGQMKTIATEINKSIVQEMQIGEYPKSKVNWTFEALSPSSTKVTWSILGENLPFIFKAYTLVKGTMEEQIGSDYERSLEKLDAVIQSEMKLYSITVSEEPTMHSGGFYLYKTVSCKMSDFKTKMKILFPEMISYAKTNAISMAGAPFILYDKWDDTTNEVVFSCCIPTTSQLEITNNDVFVGQIVPFKAIKTTLKGDYENLKEAWETTFKAINKKGITIKENQPMLEYYLNAPDTILNPADLKVEIYIPID